jgi:hypothetical protein
MKQLKKMITILITVVIILMLKRIYINDINRFKITGSDKYMIKLKKNTYCCGHYDLFENGTQIEKVDSTAFERCPNLKQIKIGEL